MDEPIKLTPADIEAAEQQLRAGPVLAGALTIGPDDIASVAPAAGATSAGQLLRITPGDLTAVPPQPAAAPNLAQLEQIMFGLVNQARQAHLPAWLPSTTLRWHPGLAAVARGHCQDMLQRHYVDHVAPEGLDAARRLDRYGITYLACGENIGVVYGPASHGQQGVVEVHRAFMDQPRSFHTHRGNLLNPIWTHVGIGVAYDAAGTLLVTQDFISAPRAA